MKSISCVPSPVDAWSCLCIRPWSPRWGAMGQGTDRSRRPCFRRAESGAREKEAGLRPDEGYMRDVDRIRASDVLIAVLSIPPHGVGYDIGFVLAAGTKSVQDDQRKPGHYVAGEIVSRLTSKHPDDARVSSNFRRG